MCIRPRTNKHKRIPNFLKRIHNLKHSNNMTLQNCKHLLLLLLSVFALTSCEHVDFFDLESSSDSSSAQTGTLTIRTRTTDDESISFPIHIYIFNSDNECYLFETLTEDDLIPFSLSLPEGTYGINVVAGADTDNYSVPTADEATTTSAVQLTGTEHSDLMAAQSSATIVFDGTNNVTLNMERMVMMLETITISNVPSSVTGVSVTVSPLYEQLLLDGTYSGTSGSQTVALTADADGTTWTNDSEVYVLPSSGKTNISVSFTTANGITTYTYSTGTTLEANYIVQIEGTYTGGDVELSGVIYGTTWSGTKSISFSFNEDGGVEKTTNGDDDTDDGTGDTGDDDNTSDENTNTGGSTANIPSAGEIYNDCYVVSTTEESGTTTVLLMSTKYAVALEFTEGDQESIKEAVATAIEEQVAIDVDGISGWRLPTYDELMLVLEDRTTISKFLYTNGYSGLHTNYCHNYQKDNGDVALGFPNAASIPTLTSGSKVFVLRAFTTITFKLTI